MEENKGELSGLKVVLNLINSIFFLTLLYTSCKYLKPNTVDVVYTISIISILTFSVILIYLEGILNYIFESTQDLNVYGVTSLYCTEESEPIPIYREANTYSFEGLPTINESVKNLKEYGLDIYEKYLSFIEIVIAVRPHLSVEEWEEIIDEFKFIINLIEAIRVEDCESVLIETLDIDIKDMLKIIEENGGPC